MSSEVSIEDLVQNGRFAAAAALALESGHPEQAMRLFEQGGWYNRAAIIAKEIGSFQNVNRLHHLHHTRINTSGVAPSVVRLRDDEHRLPDQNPNDMSVADAVNAGTATMESYFPMNEMSYDAHSAITQAGRSGENFGRRRGTSKVRRGDRRNGFRDPFETRGPLVQRPSYVVQQPIPGWWYHPQSQGIERVFLRGDSTADLDIRNTLPYLRNLNRNDPKQVSDAQYALMAEVSLSIARDPDIPEGPKIMGNIRILQTIFENYRQGKPIIPHTTYTLR